MIDTGLGVASLYDALNRTVGKPITAVATHTHLDHVGGHHEFSHTVVHQAEAQNLRSPVWRGTLLSSGLGDDFLQYLDRVGYPIEADLLTALPHAEYDMAKYQVQDSHVSEIVKEGDVIDVGDRAYEVLHLPGHSPGSIGLWDVSTGTLFSGDAIYDGPLLDDIDGADVSEYIRTQ
ncbi:glyoxylase-like metal-dependent hydrolase (beta-lactamase superfamily II) [Paraburkholderia sp. GAS333]|uniref:MBL fold metallo-hydrolase n=1 Tax=Paraburkholderia sp. GAS333 TaxID=3156279 RepID=UPI003D1B0D87